MKPRVTLRCIASSLGISHVAVSLALKDSPKISGAMRDKIKETANRMGYRPDPFLAVLSHYRLASRPKLGIKACLAWLAFVDTKAYQESREYFKGAKETALLHGYHLDEFQPSPDLSLARIQQILIHRGITGILLSPNRNNAQRLTESSFDWSRFSTVAFGHSHSQLPVHVVTNDQTATGKLGFRSIAARGYQRIGLVMEDAALIYTYFASGFMQEQARIPAANHIAPCILPAADPSKHLEIFSKWLHRSKPDAILTNIAQLPKLMAELRMRIPEDLAIASTSVLDGNTSAGINQNAEEIGRVAAETLISLINNQHKGFPRFQRQILVEGFWVDGDSLPDKRTTTG